ncbi:MAG: hypothetical protein KGL39_54990, partial [Patescibacteria group bacterium]|nr:hypothetical protein [Patescibacteria group bacterium]
AAFFQRHDSVLPVALVVVFVGVLAWWAIDSFESFWITMTAIVVVTLLVMVAAETPLGRFLMTGVRAVKSRTCPRVEITDR